ncbi:MAG TPA: hypothetical protein VD906_08505 [Caulobacteraceae bacterium]|nr:hypothetical protein [Caulobacteraceae bacterium]
MPRVSLAFFGAGVLCVLVGMVWGTIMGATQDHSMSPAHAHLNLLGFVALSIMGTFYALAGDRAPIRLAWVNFVLSFGGVLIVIPMLAQILAGNTALGPLMAIPELMIIGGAGCFLAAIVMVWRRTGVSVADAPAAKVDAARMAAE